MYIYKHANNKKNYRTHPDSGILFPKIFTLTPWAVRKRRRTSHSFTP